MTENEIEQPESLGKIIAQLVKELLQEEFKQQVPIIKHDLLMPKYLYHCPMDYAYESSAPLFEPKELDWVKDNHPQSMLDKPEMDTDFFFYGDASNSQTFYKEEILKKYWNRYMTVLELLPPPEKFSFQNWIVLKNP